MRLTTLWAADSTAAREAAGDASFPGTGDRCELPAQRVSPVVHRFESVVVLDDEVLRVPGLSDWLPVARRAPGVPDPLAEELWASLGLAGANLHDAVEALFTGVPIHDMAAINWVSRPWELRKSLWALHVVVEQAWDALGVTLGEPISSLSLAPGEEREVSVFSWHKTQETLDLSTTEIVDRQVSTQLTTHDSFQVVHRAEKESHWEMSSELSFGKGAASGSVNASAGGSSKDLLERQFKRTRDLTRKVTEQIRSERKTRITSVQDTGREERRTIRLRNPNACHSLSYEFYEQLAHYRVRAAPAEVSYAVVVANPLPQITPEWVSCHEGILREALLDESMADGFSAARRLRLSRPRSVLFEAAVKLQSAFRALPPDPESDGGGGGGFLDFLGDLATGALGGISGLVSLLSSGGGSGQAKHPVEALGVPPSSQAVSGYLDGLVREPTLQGLTGALLLLARYYGDKPQPAGLQVAFGFAVNLIAAELGAAAAEADAAEEEAATVGVEQEVEQVRKDKAERAEATAAFERLRCHLEENLLHYMRRIWIAEDPAARYARLASYTIAGSRLWDLAENRLLGFHLNGSIFPVTLGEDLEERLRALIEGVAVPEVQLPIAVGVNRFVATVPDAASEADRVTREAADRLKAERREKVRSRLVGERLARVMSRSVAPGEPPHEEGDRPVAGRLAAALHEAGQRLEKLGDDALLTRPEGELLQRVGELAAEYRSVQVDELVLQGHYSDLVDAARRLRELTTESEMFLTMPTSAVHVEPLLGSCSACDELTSRKVEADVGSAEAERDLAQIEARRRKERVEAGNLEADTVPATLHVKLERVD